MANMGLIQERIEMIENDINPYFVAELKTGYVVMGDHQKFLGYTLFISKSAATELHQLDDETRIDFLYEMSLVAAAVFAAFKPEKLNYELLGNGDPHMHWHLFPRNQDDGVHGPVWWLSKEEREVVLTEKEMNNLRATLAREISSNPKLSGHIIRLYTE